MQVHVNTDRQIQGGESLALWVEQETLARLARFREQVTRVEIFLSDENGGKAGASDKRCRMEARPAGLPPVTVTATADKVADAFTGATEKLLRALDADIGRGKNYKGGETIRTGE
ncbi:MAG: HPF/RaiA family ribosome-associated protein [Comamonas sp.]|nr:HPF/RaiA family ribosome-associated protein [Comamonas sp.]